MKFANLNVIKLIRDLFFSAVLFVPALANAALEIEISGGGAQQIPIAIVPFGGAANTKDNMSEIIAADLNRSGLFRVLETRGMANLPTTPEQIKYAEWVALQAQAVTVGNVESAGGKLKVTFHLMDALKQTQLAGMDYQIAPSQVRITAHKIADIIYQKLTGQTGLFASRIAYITKTGKRYALQVADADGYNPQTVVSSNEPIISPAWSPDGSKLAYVSFEKKKPIIYVQSLSSGSREVLASYKGNNSAPAWAPDGSQIYFSSDRGGKPQIYKVPASGGSPSRVTFEGGYNVSPRFSPDGKSLAYIRNDGGKFKVALQDLASGQVQILSEGAQDESPSFAPNGRVILYATKVGGRGALAAVSSDGKVRQRLKDGSGGDVREPAWGPLAK